jgi:hypothetical protein
MTICIEKRILCGWMWQAHAIIIASYALNKHQTIIIYKRERPPLRAHMSNYTHACCCCVTHFYIYICGMAEREHYGGGGAAWPFKLLLTMRAALDANKFI